MKSIQATNQLEQAFDQLKSKAIDVNRFKRESQDNFDFHLGFVLKAIEGVENGSIDKKDIETKFTKLADSLKMDLLTIAKNIANS